MRIETEYIRIKLIDLTVGRPIKTLNGGPLSTSKRTSHEPINNYAGSKQPSLVQCVVLRWANHRMNTQENSTEQNGKNMVEVMISEVR